MQENIVPKGKKLGYLVSSVCMYTILHVHGIISNTNLK